MKYSLQRMQRLITGKMKALKIKDGDILILRAAKPLIFRAEAMALAGWLRNNDRGKCLVMTLPPGVKLEIIGTETLAQHGLQRISEAGETGV